MSTRRRKQVRRLRPWTSPLIDNLAGGVISGGGRESCMKNKTSSTLEVTNKRVTFHDTPPRPPHRTCDYNNNINDNILMTTTTTTAMTSIESRTDIALWNIRHLQRSMRRYRKQLSHERKEARLAVMEVQQVRNEIHTMLDAHYPFHRLEEELHDSFSSSMDYSSSSILSLSTSDEHTNDEMNQTLHLFLDNLIEEASPIHSTPY